MFHFAQDRYIYWNTSNAEKNREQPKIRLDTNPIIADPMIEMPGSESLLKLNPKTINLISYFKLKADSPASKAGKLIENNGGKDYWGHQVPGNGASNSGADNE